MFSILSDSPVNHILNNGISETHKVMELRNKIRRNRALEPVVKDSIRRVVNQKLPTLPILIPSNRGFSDTDLMKESRNKLRFNKAHTRFEDDRKYGIDKKAYL